MKKVNIQLLDSVKIPENAKSLLKKILTDSISFSSLSNLQEDFFALLPDMKKEELKHNSSAKNSSLFSGQATSDIPDFSDYKEDIPLKTEKKTETAAPVVELEAVEEKGVIRGASWNISSFLKTLFRKNRELKEEAKKDKTRLNLLSFFKKNRKDEYNTETEKTTLFSFIPRTVNDYFLGSRKKTLSDAGISTEEKEQQILPERLDKKENADYSNTKTDSLNNSAVSFSERKKYSEKTFSEKIIPKGENVDKKESEPLRPDNTDKVGVYTIPDSEKSFSMEDSLPEDEITEEISYGKIENERNTGSFKIKNGKPENNSYTDLPISSIADNSSYSAINHDNNITYYSLDKDNSEEDTAINENQIRETKDIEAKKETADAEEKTVESITEQDRLPDEETKRDSFFKRFLKWIKKILKAIFR